MAELDIDSSEVDENPAGRRMAACIAEAPGASSPTSDEGLTEDQKDSREAGQSPPADNIKASQKEKRPKLHKLASVIAGVQDLKHDGAEHKKKVLKMAADHNENDDEDSSSKVSMRWKRVSLWAKSGNQSFETQGASTRKAVVGGDAIKAIQTVRLWKESAQRSLECSKFRFRAKLARRMTYALAREFLDDEHCIFNEGEARHSIKEIFQAIAVGVQQVLLMSKVANIFMALIAEMQIREQLAKVTRDLCQTRDWTEFKEKLAAVKSQMHEALDMHRDLVDFTVPQEQMTFVQELVEKQEKMHKQAVDRLKRIQICQAFIPKLKMDKDGKPAEPETSEEERNAEKLWQELLDQKNYLKDAMENCTQLQQAISMLGRGGHDDEPPGDIVESEISAQRDNSFLSVMPQPVIDKLVDALKDMGTHDPDAYEFCKEEIETLGANQQEVADTIAALRRVAWRACCKDAADTLKDEETEFSMNELKLAISQYEWAVPDSIKSQNPERPPVPPMEMLVRIKNKLRKYKIAVPKGLETLSEKSPSANMSKRALAHNWLDHARVVLSNRPSAIAGDDPKRGNPFFGVGTGLSAADLAAKLKDPAAPRSRTFSFCKANDNDASDDSDSGESDKPAELDTIYGGSWYQGVASGAQEDALDALQEHTSAINLQVPPSPGRGRVSPSPLIVKIDEEEEQEEEENLPDKGEEDGEDSQISGDDDSDDRQILHREGPHIQVGTVVIDSEDADKQGDVDDDADESGVEVARELVNCKPPESEPPGSDEVASGSDPVLNAILELRHSVISAFRGVEEAAEELASCGGDVGGSGMISMTAAHRRLLENGYKRGIAELCTLFRCLDLSFVTEETTITKEQFKRLADVHTFYQNVQQDEEKFNELHKLFSTVQLRRVLMDTINEDETLLSAVAIALSSTIDVANGGADVEAMQPLIIAMGHCFEALHGQHSKRFASAVLSKWGMRILTDVIACSALSKEIRTAAVILISEALAHNGFPPCSSLHEDFKKRQGVKESQVEMTLMEAAQHAEDGNVKVFDQEFLMEEIWRPVLFTIDPDGPGPPPPLDSELLEQMFLLLLQVHMPGWLLSNPVSKLPAELSLALRLLHACASEGEALLHALRTFQLFEEDQEGQHALTEVHALAAALGGCRLLREQLALLHVTEENDGRSKGRPSASERFARDGDQMLRLWRAAREKLSSRYPVLRRKPTPLQKLKAVLKAAWVCTSAGFQASEPKVVLGETHDEKQLTRTSQSQKASREMGWMRCTQEQIQEMDPIFLAGSVEHEAVLRLEQRWQLFNEKEQQSRYWYDWSRPSIPPLAQATKQSQAYMTRNGLKPLPLVPPKSSQGKRRRKKDEPPGQTADGTHVVMLSSGGTLLRTAPRPVSRATPPAGRSLLPLPQSRVIGAGHEPPAWDEAVGTTERRVQTANAGSRTQEMPWTVPDLPHERSRPCTTGKLGIEKIAMWRAPWQAQNGPPGRQKLGALPALDHFPELRAAERAWV